MVSRDKDLVGVGQIEVWNIEHWVSGRSALVLGNHEGSGIVSPSYMYIRARMNTIVFVRTEILSTTP